jgi:tetratricopeptide (TPR) repeat protein
MDLQTSLLRQLENPNLSRDQWAQLRCQIAKELEEAGSYEESREALSELWRRIGERPAIKELEPEIAGEVLLRAGVLTGWIGDRQQVEGAQETAKNLITEAIAIFESLNYVKKIAEAETELAYCYWRTGGYNEARIILQGVLSRLTIDSELKAKAVLRSAIVERAATRYKDALRILTGAVSLFEKLNNHTIRGGYHNELAIVLRNLGTTERREDYTDRAFLEYTAAGYYFEQAGHRIYRANVENNLGFLHFKAGRFKSASKREALSHRLMRLAPASFLQRANLGKLRE